MKILAIETSCDETAAAVTEGAKVWSSVKITQEIHAEFGGVVPSLAKRDHEANIDWVINKSLEEAKFRIQDSIDAIAVTAGPGLAIALEVGIKKAKELAREHNKPLITVNHLEGHLLSSLIRAEKFKFEILNLKFPCLGLVVSGGHTLLLRINKIGDYETMIKSRDDDIGEAIDKGARMLGLPYPGGPALEKAAKNGDATKYQLPIPMLGHEGEYFSYSGLKSAFYRLVKQVSGDNFQLSQEVISDLAAIYQKRVFEHLIRSIKAVLKTSPPAPLLNPGEGYLLDLMVGGGVAANQELRERLSDLATELNLRVHFPENLMLCTDNAAMIGVAAGYKFEKGQFADPSAVDRAPRSSDNLRFSWENDVK